MPDPATDQMTQALAQQPQPQAADAAALSPAALAAIFLSPMSTGGFSNQRPIKWGESGVYQATHHTGAPAGTASLYYNPETKTVRVGMMSSAPTGRPGFEVAEENPIAGVGLPRSAMGQGAIRANERSWTMGPAELASVPPELKRIWPDAENVTGERVSGARNLRSSTVTRPIAEMPAMPAGKMSEGQLQTEMARALRGLPPTEQRPLAEAGPEMFRNPVAKAQAGARGMLIPPKNPVPGEGGWGGMNPILQNWQ
jgi:hypothetical protein